jgi:hypothetical protein
MLPADWIALAAVVVSIAAIIAYLSKRDGK